VSGIPPRTSSAATADDPTAGELMSSDEAQFRAMVTAIVARSRKAQGLPPNVEDDATLRRVAAVVTSAPLRQAG